MKVILGSDHGAYKLKEEVNEHLQVLGFEVANMGVYAEDSCDYPIIAKDVYNEFIKDKNCKVIVLCGTGIGIANAITRYKGIKCVHTMHPFIVRRAVDKFGVNTLALGGRIIGVEQAKSCVNSFLNRHFN